MLPFERGLFALAFLALAACHDPDNGPQSSKEAETFLPELTPSDATFTMKTRHDGRLILSIKISKANMCERAEVPANTDFVQVEVIAAALPIPPGTFPVGHDAPGRISGQRTSGDACGGAAGQGALTGTITLTEVADGRVVGTYKGTNRGIVYEGSFDAKRCAASANECL